MPTEVIQADLSVVEAGNDPIVIDVNLTLVDAEDGSGPPPGPGGRRRPVIVACGD